MTPGTLSVVLRSTLFAAFQVALTVPYSLIALATFPLPLRARYRVITLWTRLNVWAAQAICGIRYRVLGADALPPAPYIVLSKHQSAWETLAFQLIFPQQVWVVKRELLWIPFFGWGLAMLAPWSVLAVIGMVAGARWAIYWLETGRLLPGTIDTR